MFHGITVAYFHVHLYLSTIANGSASEYNILNSKYFTRAVFRSITICFQSSIWYHISNMHVRIFAHKKTQVPKWCGLGIMTRAPTLILYLHYSFKFNSNIRQCHTAKRVITCNITSTGQYAALHKKPSVPNQLVVRVIY